MNACGKSIRRQSWTLFNKWADEHVADVGKTGKLAKAVHYAKQQRAYVRRRFSGGRFEIDNGAVRPRQRAHKAAAESAYGAGRGWVCLFSFRRSLASTNPLT